MKISAVPRKRTIATEDVRALKLAGLSLREIAARLDVSQEAIRKALTRADGRPPITIEVGPDSLTITGAPDQLAAAKAIAQHFRAAGFPVAATKRP